MILGIPIPGHLATYAVPQENGRFAVLNVWGATWWLRRVGNGIGFSRDGLLVDFASIDEASEYLGQLKYEHRVKRWRQENRVTTARITLIY
jgi:hypothetical protein